MWWYNCVKNGRVRQQQLRLCKDCGYNFIEGDKRKERCSLALKSLARLLCCLGLSFRLVAKLFNLSHSTVQVWFDQMAETFPPLDVPTDAVQEVELDEMRTFVQSKKNELWINKATAVVAGRVRLLAVEVGRRDTNTVKQVIDSLEVKYQPLRYCTDNWSAYQKAVPEGKHATGKDKIYRIEQHNSDTRHYTARLRRKSKVVTHNPERLKNTVLAVEYLTKQGGLEKMRANYLSIF